MQALSIHLRFSVFPSRALAAAFLRIHTAAGTLAGGWDADRRGMQASRF
jgi:hypothetical protein